MGRPIPALTLPLATGGTGTLTYTLTGPASAALSQAVPGLTFTATTRVLSGTPTTAATTVLTYTVTDERGSTASDTVTVTVAAQVAVTAPGDQTYTMGQTITDLTLPAATGGTGTLTYTLRDGTGNDVDGTDNAVPGLTFNTTARVLTGTPTTAATTVLTYTVTDERGSTASDTVTVTVADGVALNAPNDLTYTMGRPIPALTLPAATGGTGTLTYTLTGPASAALSQAVPGLTFNTTARVLSGTPTTAATTVLTYTVTDERGSTASDTVTVTVADGVTLNAPNDQTYTMGRPIPALTLPAATGGTGTLTYTLTGPASAALSQAVPGLTFNTTARVLSGTPTTATTTVLTYTVTDERGSTASDTVTLTVADGVTLNAPNDLTYTMGRPIPALTLPLATGGTGTLTYTLTGPASAALSQAVPGLTFNTTSRVLSGTPTTAATTALTYTVTDERGSTASDTVTLTVADGVTLNAPNDLTYTMGTEIPALTLPAATGGTGTLTYTLRDGTGNDVDGTDNAVPGLTFNTTSRVLSGTPTTATTTVLTYTVTDERGSTASDTVPLTVADGVVLNAPNDLTYTMGRPIPALTLPAATGGTGTLTYTLTGPASAALSQAVPGLTFTATTRVLSGTPTTAATTALTYTVTDERGSTASATVTVTVAAGVALNAPGDQTYTMGRPIPALTLPAATGGTGTLTYTLRDGTGNDVDTTDNAVPGLIFNTISRVLTGTPTTAATTDLTYTVTDERGSTASDTVTLTVADGVALNAPGDQTYTVDRPITALTLPTATGGTGTLTYTLRDAGGNDVDTTDNAVPGLTFNTTSRVLSGTPTTAATTVLTYTVTDQNGSTASATVTITVATGVALNAPNDQTYTVDRPITALTLPTATGGTGTLTYTLRDAGGNDVDTTDNAVPGLTFNTASRVLSGTPTTAATTVLTYTVTDQNGSTASATVTITVATGVALNAPNDQTYTMGQTITDLTLPPATGGTGTLTYTLRDGTGNDVDAIDNAIPGLTFNTTTRVLSGTPTTTATTPLTYTVTDENGSTASATVTLTVAAAVALNAPTDQTYTMGTEIPALTLPTATGGTGTLTYTLTGPSDAALNVAVPGLTFTATARVLSGTPTTAATTVLTYTVTDERGSTASDTVTLTVADGVALNAPGDQTYTMGRPIPALTLPAATGGTGTLTYTLRDGIGNDVDGTDNAVPGLIFNTTSRVLTGTPTTATTTALTYTVTDEHGSTASDTVTLTVAAAVAVTAPSDQTYTMGQTITALTLSAATGGTGTLTYTLRDGSGNDVDGTDQAVPGLTFNTTTRALSGTPTTAATTALTYTVTDENGSTASDTLTLTVATGVALNAPNDQTYTIGRPITALTLPAATGGTGTLTYTLRDGSGNDVDGTDNAVPGLTFNTTARVLSGTPTTATTTALTYTVTDERGSTASDTFDITVATGVALNAPNNQTYTMGRPITALTLPAATGGTGTLTYALRDGSGNDVDGTDNAVPGLIFNTTTRVLSGTPTTAATTALTYTVADERGSTASDTFTLTVATGVALNAPNDQTYTMGQTITALTLPAATGGTGTLTYTLRDGSGNDVDGTDNAVPGLTFNTTARVLSGTPTTATTTALTYTVTDENGSTASDTLTLTVATGVALNAPNDQTYTMGRQIPALTLPPATGGTGTLTYTLRDAGGNDVDGTDNAVPGLTFTATSRVLTGTPTTAATTALTYTVTDERGSTASDTLTITVATGVALNAPNDQTYTMGQTITALTLPAATGGTGTLTYTLTGPSDAALNVAVPGLTFDTTARVLSGTPTTQATTALTYTVTDQNGSTASATFDITVATGVALNAPGDQTYTVDRPITALTLPTATGGTGTLTYTLRDAGGNDVDTTDNAVPGLTFDTTTRVLTGTPTTAAATALTYTVTDERGSTASATFDITVATGVALNTPGDQTYTVDRPITALTLPMATGGTGTLTYTLRDTGGNDVDAVDNAVPGLAFDPLSRVLSGTPTTAAATALTYTVTDEHGSTASDTLTLTVATGVALNAPSDQTYTIGRPITALTLPAATGGTGTLTYTLRDAGGNDVDGTDNAVPGLAFDPLSRVLSGTPTTAATTALTYTVTDERGSTASDTLSLTVATGVALNAPNNQTYTMGRPITALTLLPATGGTGTLTYTLTGPSDAALNVAVPGLIFNATTRVLSGTPTTAATTALTYTVTDENGSIASATFDITVAAAVALNAPGDQTYTMGTEIPALTLPAAIGGTGTLTYTLRDGSGNDVDATDNAVPGLTFTATTRTLTGTPTTAATTALTYTVTDDNGSTASATFDITVADGVALNAPTDQAYTMGRPIPALTLPAATGGTGTLTYTLRDAGGNDVDAIDNAVPGLTFNTTSRVLSGTPTTTATTVLTYTVTDQNGSTASATVTITVATGVALNAPNDQTYTMGRPIPALTLPAATGGTGMLTYTLRDGSGNDVDITDNAVPGLAFNTASRVLSGTPTTAATTVLTYTVADERGSTASATVTVTVAAGVALNAPGDQTYTMGRPIPALTLPAATGGTGTLTYTLRDGSGNDVDITDNAVPGLTFNTTSRVLSGTPTTAATTALTYTVADERGSTASDTFTLTVATGVALNAPNDQTYTMGQTITALTLPAATGGTGTLTYTLRDGSGNDVDGTDNAVPGLTFNTTARVLSGTPTTATTTALTYTVTDERGSTASDTLTLTVATGVALNAPNDQTYTMGRQIPALTLPTATGGTGTLTYTLRDAGGNDVDTTDNAVPGLTFDTTTRVLTGTPTTAATTVLTYTVADERGSTASATFDITVATGVALNTPGDQTYTVDRPITALTLPMATGGTGTLTYTLRDTGGNDVDAVDNAVPGLAFDPLSRVLSGTPTTAATTALTYTVTDEHGSTASDTLTLTVATGVALNAPSDQTYTIGRPITALTLPAATGGTGTLTYTLRDAGGNDVDGTDNAVPGLAFDPLSRVLSGTPTTAATTALTYTVTDERGSTASDTLTLTVAAGVALNAPNNQTYTMGRPITALTLLPATGGTGTLTYTLTGPSDAALNVAVPGLIFNTTSRVLSGTPTTAATTALTYTVTDENGSIASATFDITVAAAVALNAPGDQTYTMGTEIPALTLPAAIGGTGTLTYTLRDGSGNDVDATDNAVPGLTFTATTRTLTGTPTTAATTALTYTVTDDNGSTASATFDITVADGVALNAPTDQAYTMGRPIPALTLPAATGGTGTLTYTLRDATGNDVDAVDNAVPGLTFDTTTRTLTGTPTTAATTALTYTVTDENGSTASANFSITVANRVMLTDQTYTTGRPIPDLTLPVGTGGTGTLTYTLTGPARAALNNAVPGLTFTATTRVLSGTPTEEGMTAMTYTVTDEHGSTASAGFRITVNDETSTNRFTALNEIILPEMARNMADSTVSSIAWRVEQAKRASVEAGLNFAGQSMDEQHNLATALRTHGEAMRTDGHDFKEMLAGSDFVLPLNVGDDAGTDASSLAFWGSGEYRDLSGKSGGLKWDGKLYGAQLGLDVRLGEDVVAGVAMSQLESNLRYTGHDDGADGPNEGTHKLNINSAYPYIGGRSGELDWWATVGYGEGELEITPQGETGKTSDVSLRTFGIGGGGSRLFQSGATIFRLKGEALQGAMKVGGSSRLDGLDVDAMRARITLEVGQSREMPNSSVVEPTLEIGARFDRGDGETGGGAEIGGSVRYHNPATRVTADGRVRTLLGHGGGYKEWGIQGSVVLHPGADGQGASFSLKPGYGDSESGIQELWRHGLTVDAHDANADADDYAVKLDARIGYGFGFAINDHDGVLTPYSEMTRGTTDSYRMGLNWKTGTRFDLTVLSERRQPATDPAEHAVLLKGEVRF